MVIISFLEKRKKQKYLLWVLLLVVLTGLTVVLYSALVGPAKPLPGEAGIVPIQKKEIIINLDILKSPVFQEFTPFEISEEATPTEEEVRVVPGRENPFVPYY